jgi:hypothetical protein
MNLILLKYDQTISPMDDDIVQDCRGIILDERRNWRVVAMAFRKFFNYRCRHAARIDWSTAVVQEKVDGTLCILYPYDGDWHVASAEYPDAAEDARAGGATLAECFWDAFADARMTLPPSACGVCFAFELVGPRNRVIVEHRRPGLAVLGCRSLRTLREESAKAATLRLRCPSRQAAVRCFPLAGLRAVEAALAGIDPLEQEGFVVVDASWARVKVKPLRPGSPACVVAENQDRRRKSQVLNPGRQRVVSTPGANAKPLGKLCGPFFAVVSPILFHVSWIWRPEGSAHFLVSMHGKLLRLRL